MKKLTVLCAMALFVGASAFADDETKQVVKIDGVVQDGKTVKTITFEGDKLNLTYTDGSTASADLEAVVIAFESDPTAITVSKVSNEGEVTKIYDINGRQVKATMDALPTGVYIMKSANKTVKFIKK